MKISRDNIRHHTLRYDLVKQGAVFEVIGGLPATTWHRISDGLVNLSSGATYSSDYISSATIVRIYPDATLVLEP